MKITKAILALGFGSSINAKPLRSREAYDLEGFARDNPIGPTTGGAGGNTVTVDNVADLTTAVSGSEPRIVYVDGSFNLTSRIKLGSNKSLIGVGDSASFNNSGITVQDVSNVIIRNLHFSYAYENDCITIQNSTRVWVDHNEFMSDIEQGPDAFDGQVDIVRASDWITVSWNYFHDHWKSSLVGNSDTLRSVDTGHLHVTYHHNHWRNMGTRGPAGRFGTLHVYNNLYEGYRYQAMHSRSDNQMLVEGNVIVTGDNTTAGAGEALSTYGLVIPMDSPNTCTCGDEELDGFANLGAENDFGGAGVNITRVGNFTSAPYEYGLTPLGEVPSVVLAGVGVGKLAI
ncbi:polysaccharide lyase family 1 protein [Xylariomycetidae sp. FL2044]|nr:polysaccharide lyase family 1 protein [Xylariomycetidae sp. FL2044]